MGAQRSTRQGVVKTEYIQFEIVLKSNFLLHEQISRKEEALNYSELQNVEYQEAIKELREALQENKEFMKGIIEDNNQMREALKTVTNTFQDYEQLQQTQQKLRQENVTLAIQIQEYKTELGKL